MLSDIMIAHKRWRPPEWAVVLRFLFAGDPTHSYIVFALCCSSCYALQAICASFNQARPTTYQCQMPDDPGEPTGPEHALWLLYPVAIPVQHPTPNRETPSCDVSNKDDEVGKMVAGPDERAALQT